MPRLHTPTERARIAQQHRNDYLVVEVKDIGGTWRELTNLNGVNWVNKCLITEDTDLSAATIQLELARSHGALSLAPLLQASALNNLTGAYSPLLYGARRMRVKAAITQPGVAPVGGDWKYLVEKGRIDRVGWDTDPVILDGRDAGSFLLDRFIEQLAEYGSTMGTALETVMQDIIDDYPPLDGATLVVIDAPAWNLKTFRQERKNVLEALNEKALQIGYNVRYMFRPSDDAYVLGLWAPDRTKVLVDWTIGPSEYDNVEELSSSDSDVRNTIDGQWVDAAGESQRLPAPSTDPASIADYGVRYMEFNEDATSNIDTQAEMERMTDAAASDLSEPAATQEIKVRGFWPVQLGDLGGFTANGVHYDADQKLAVRGFRHEFINSEWWTYIRTGGKPIAAFRSWLNRSKDDSESDQLVANLVTDVATTSQVTMHVDTSAPGSPTKPTVKLVAVYFGATRLSGTAAGTPAVSGSAWTFSRPGVTSEMAGVAEFLLELPGFTSRKFFYYITNAQPGLTITPQISVTTFSIVWSGLGTITLDIDGGGYSTPPASPINGSRSASDHVYTFRAVYGGQIVTNSVTIPSTEKDTVPTDLDVVAGVPTDTDSPFTVTSTRADTGATVTFDSTCRKCQMVIGGVTYGPDVTVSGIASGTVVTGLRPVSTQTEQATLKFKASVAGGGTEEILRTIPAQLNKGPTLTARGTNSPTDTTIDWFAIGTVTVSIDGGAYATPSASPIVVARDGDPHTYNFKADKDGQVINVEVTIPAIPPASSVGFSSVDIGSFYSPCDGGGDAIVTWSTVGLDPGDTFDVTVSITSGTYNGSSVLYAGAASGFHASSSAFCPGESGRVSIVAQRAGVGIVATGYTDFSS